MSIKQLIMSLEKRGIISRKPHPIIPFLITIVFYILLTIIKKLNMGDIIINVSVFLLIFSFIFAILHLIVVKTLKS